MSYGIFYYVIICYVFSEATTTVPQIFTNSTGKQPCWSLFFSPKMTKLYKDISSPPYMHKTLPTLGNEKEQQKSNLTKNPRESWFSRGQLKISKWSISLARVGECSKGYTTGYHTTRPRKSA